MAANRSTILCVCALLGTGLVGACSGDDGSSAPAIDQRAAATADQPTAAELPAGHPPVATDPAASLIVPPPPGSGTGTSGLRWTVPAGWLEETPSSAMRRAQYRVPGAGGEAECVVFYFGPGQGGDAMANARRWAEQFRQPDGSSSTDALKTERIEVAGIPVLLAEVTGTYSGGMTMMGGPQQNLTDYMLLGAIAEGGDANWFFKFTGPEATVEPQRQAFRSMIESLSRGG